MRLTNNARKNNLNQPKGKVNTINKQGFMKESVSFHLKRGNLIIFSALLCDKLRVPLRFQVL
jgi:hypothetical protein